MNELNLNRRRIELLQQAIDKVAGGNKTAFGKRLNYKDGAFVRQMLSGERPISEKTIRVIESIPGLRGWFASDFPTHVLSSGETENTGEKTALTGGPASRITSDDSRYVSPAEGVIEKSAVQLQYDADPAKLRRIYVIGKAEGGLPELLWKGGEYPVGATNEYAELASSDQRAFICPVVGDSMFPRFMPGEYVLVQPSRAPEVEDTVLVRLKTGETMLKRLLSRRDDHVRLGAWNDQTIYSYREDEVSWMYTVAHTVPTWMIQQLT